MAETVIVNIVGFAGAVLLLCFVADRAGSGSLCPLILRGLGTVHSGSSVPDDHWEHIVMEDNCCALRGMVGIPRWRSSYDQAATRNGAARDSD